MSPISLLSPTLPLFEIGIQLLSLMEIVTVVVSVVISLISLTTLCSELYIMTNYSIPHLYCLWALLQ